MYERMLKSRQVVRGELLKTGIQDNVYGTKIVLLDG